MFRHHLLLIGVFCATPASYRSAGVLIVSRSVLAVKASVQGYFYSCFCTLKGEYIIFFII
jgi:hypothetical protein